MSDSEKHKPENDKKSIGQSKLVDNLANDVSNAFIPPEVVNEIEQNAANLSNPEIKPQNIDKDGVVFNPEIHATDKSGEPSVTKMGKFRAKKGVSKVAMKDAKKVDEIQKDLNSIKMTSMAATGLFIHTGCAIFGDEWLPEKEPDEKAILDDAFFNYFKEKEIKDFPVGVALTVAIIGYSLPRFTKPKTLNRTQQIKNKILERYFAWKGKKQNGSHSGAGKNGKRENNLDKKDSQGSEKSGRISPSS